MSLTTKPQNIALVHDWLPIIGGAERVLSEFTHAFPSSDIFTLFDFLTQDDKTALFGNSDVTASSLNKLPLVHRYYRNLIPLCTRQIEKFDLSKYDAVLSSSACFAKGVLTHPDQAHVAYIHSPPRYAWDMMHDYLQESGNDRGLRALVAHELMHRLRMWDLRTVPSMDRILCNSNFVSRRIKKYYNRDARVVAPPVDVDFFTFKETKDDYFLTASRFVPYKKIKLIVEAFNEMPDKKLVVIGHGPEEDAIRKIARGNIELVGWLSRPEMLTYFQNAKAFVFAAVEDFGIVPLEAQACGTPVIAMDKGGTAETIVGLASNAKPTGVLFTDQTVGNIVGAVKNFEGNIDKISPQACRENAECYAPERFVSSIQSEVLDAIREVKER